jgi:hypothetical protein
MIVDHDTLTFEVGESNQLANAIAVVLVVFMVLIFHIVTGTSGVYTFRA